MPSRHISSKSFDEILSDLGDDPAIPDPHGIRKNSSPTKSQPNEEVVAHKRTLLELPPVLQVKPSVLFFAIGILVCASALGLFFTLEAFKLDSQVTLAELREQIYLLKQELQSTRENWALDQEDLYEILDELEVSIHAHKISSPILKPIKQATTYPHEAELLRWRYLGLSRAGTIEQAFFHTGKKAIMLKKGGLAVGDWQLDQIDIDEVIFTHPKGKSLFLRTPKNK